MRDAGRSSGFASDCGRACARLTCVDSIPRQVVNAALRIDLPFFAIACVILLAGVFALLLWRLRLRDRLLLWVGVFSILYALACSLETNWFAPRRSNSEDRACAACL